jgi:hypothetical protein
VLQAQQPGVDRARRGLRRGRVELLQEAVERDAQRRLVRLPAGLRRQQEQAQPGNRLLVPAERRLHVVDVDTVDAEATEKTRVGCARRRPLRR